LSWAVKIEEARIEAAVGAGTRKRASEEEEAE
jgi:hypothetical protein